MGLLTLYFENSSLPDIISYTGITSSILDKKRNFLRKKEIALLRTFYIMWLFTRRDNVADQAKIDLFIVRRQINDKCLYTPI